MCRELGQRIDGVTQGGELGERGGETRCRLTRGPERLAAHLGLEPVPLIGRIEGAHVLEQVARGRAVGSQPGAASEAEDAAADRGVAKRHRPTRRERDAVLREHLLEQRRRARRGAVHDRDLLGADARPQQLDHLGRHELGLGALASGLEQRDRLAGLGALRRRRLEQAALHVVQDRS